jgi:glycosyltransferase involved in cell wall biosynthesis
VSNKIRILAVDTIAVEAARRSAYRALAHMDGCEVHLLVPSAWQEQGSVTPAEPEGDPRLHLHTSRITFGFRQHRVLYSSLRSQLRELKPDILYIDTEPENYTAAQCRLVIDAASPHTRLALVSSRNLDYRSIGFPYKFAFTHRWCDALARRRPSDIMFVRPRSTMYLLEGYARSVVHLPHPVDCVLFSPGTPATLPAVDGAFIVGYVGRLVESKGVQLLIRALARLPVNVHALIVGNGPNRQNLEALARQVGVAGRVRFEPAVPYKSVPGVMRSMQALVLPSLPTSHWVEQFGRVLIESMACGVPVVASRSGGIPEILGDGGVLVEPGDEDPLVLAIDDLLVHPSRCVALGSKGRARALQNYSAGVVAGIMRRTFNSSLWPLPAGLVPGTPSTR